MKLLLDEQSSGLKEYLELLGWEVLTINDVKLSGKPDKEVVKYAKQKGLTLITRDGGQADQASMMDLDHVWISQGLIAKAVDEELRKK
ncbi:MAG: DUF5615 family PIN-like protein [Candidatus Bathyarchaeota archaeon]|nr:DUF5615 family PIN-like protein [Candidatus Bathyarchaeota archaeon]